MNRERMAWLVSIVLVALLAFQLPGSLAQRDDDYAFVRTLVDIHRQVAANYVDPVDEDKLRQGAIDGMLEQLDPYSVYVPPKKQEEFDRMLEGTFKGVGIQLDQADNGDIEVVSPIEDSPAFKAGVLAGDVILRINGKDVKGKKLKDVIADIGSGPLEVTMRVRHPDRRGGGPAEDDPPGDRAADGQGLPPQGRQHVGLVRGATTRKSPTCGSPSSRPTRSTSSRPTLEARLAEGMQGLILDLRFNPGGRLDQAEKVVNLFVKEGTIVVTRGRNRPEEIAQGRPGGSAAAAVPDGGAGQRALGQRVGDRGRQPDGQPPGAGARHAHLRQGLGAGSDPDGRRPRAGELKLTVAYYYLPSGRLVHRKKDATDWGVEPQVNVPMDANDEKRLIQQQSDLEIIGRPLPKATSKPATAPTTGPATQPAPFVDNQLEAAVSTMVGHIILDGETGRRAR